MGKNMSHEIPKSPLKIVKFKYFAKQIMNSFLPDYKLSNDIEFA